MNPEEIEFSFEESQRAIKQHLSYQERQQDDVVQLPYEQQIEEEIKSVDSYLQQPATQEPKFLGLMPEAKEDTALPQGSGAMAILNDLINRE